MTKTVGIQDKPEVDLEAIEAAKAEDEAKAAAIAQGLEDDDEGEEGEEGEEGKKKVEKKDETDYKAKFTESQKEALVLKAQLDKIEEEKNKKIDVTDDFLKNKYPDWEDMTTGEQTAIRKSEILEQEITQIKNNSNKFNNDRAWQEKVEAFTTDELPDSFPDLVGREDEFQRFATRPTRKGLPMDDLAKIFLFENPKKPAKKASLFHAPGGAGNAPKTSEGMSADDVQLLRTTKPLEYMRLVRAKKIKIKL